MTNITKNIPEHLENDPFAPYNALPEDVYNFKTIEPHSKLNSYDGFNYNGYYIKFSKSVSDEIFNKSYEYAEVKIDIIKEAFCIKFFKNKDKKNLFKISTNTIYPRIHIKSKGMPAGRYYKSEDDSNIYVYQL